MNKFPELTPEQIETAKRLRLTPNGKHKVTGWRQVAERMGVGFDQLLRHFDPEQAKRRQGWRNASAGKWRRRARPGGVACGRADGSMVPPEDVLAARDRLLSLERDPIAELTGDPPPGRSALDQKRRQGEARP